MPDRFRFGGPFRYPARGALLAALLAAGSATASCGDGGDSPGASDQVGTSPPATAPADTVPLTVVLPEPSSGPGEAGVRPEGFTTVTVRITDAAGEVCEVCMWLADDGDERGRGLMGVTDLGEPVGMAFAFPRPVDGAFYMLGTPTPLSIAWFAPGGAFVSATDMEPCTTSIAADCERFRAAGTYQLAIEVFAGGLSALGVGPDSTAEVVEGSESPTCVVAGER